MAYVLYVVSPFGGYPRGALITDPTVMANIEDGEDAPNVVKVGEVVGVPTPPGGGVGGGSDVTMTQLVQAVNALIAQQNLLVASVASLADTNAVQSALLSQHTTQIAQILQSIQVIQARLDNPQGGVPVPPDLLDDAYLAENDNVVLATDDDAILAGDIS